MSIACIVGRFAAVTPQLRVIATLALCAVCVAGHAAEPTSAPGRSDSMYESLADALKPRAFFVQLGLADEATSGGFGLIWNPWRGMVPSPWDLYVEASVSRWQSRGGYLSDHGVLTQLALIPVFRYRMDDGRSPWFLEGGVGATATSSVYRNGTKHFSTAFNFGSHIGAGYSFGAAKKHEVALRVEHFSNAGIKHPNPGENFVELRYLRHFD